MLIIFCDILYILTSVVTSSALVFIVDFLRDMYKETRFKPQRKDWLPSHLKMPVRFTLIQHDGQRTYSRPHDICCRHRRGSFVVDRLAKCNSARSIKDIFFSFSKSILIEGVPGIGKSVLSNEVAYYWATGEILVGMNLFHLNASDNDLHSISSTSDLFRYLNTKHDIFSDSEIEIATSELKNSKGSNMIFLIDGYNECPVDCQLRLFVDKLLSVEFLPKCRIVIITRPSATVSLYHLVEQRYEIIGLTSTEQNNYISEAFKETPEKKIELKKYLALYPIIKILTYSPFYLSVLLHLAKQDNLPKTLTEITDLLIVYTMRRELTNQGQLFIGINKLVELPKSDLVCVHHLAQLAFEGIKSQRYNNDSFRWFPVFTLSEVKKICPQNDRFSVASDGFGFLHVLEQYSPERETCFSFIHDAIQSFLAALHISMIDDEKQLLLIKREFKMSFIWTMYAGITKQGPRHLNPSHITATTFNELVHLQLFQYYWEANKSVYIYPLSSTDEKVEVKYECLSSHDFMSLMFFLIKYPVQWKSITIKCSMICDSKIKMLGQCFTKYKNKFTSLEHICLTNNEISLEGTCAHELLSKTHSLQSLDLRQNRIGDVGSTKLANAMLKLMDETNNWTGNLKIAEAICVNKTLQQLDISGIKLIEVPKNEVLKISNSLKCNNTLSKLKMSWEGFRKLSFDRSTKSCVFYRCDIGDIGACVLSGFLCYNTTVQKLTVSFIEMNAHGAAAISECLKENKALVEINMSINRIFSEGAMQIANALLVNNTVRKLDISDNNIGDEGVIAMSECIKTNNTLEELHVAHNSITAKGVKRISRALQINTTLRKLNISNNNLSYDGAVAISDCLTVHCSLVELNISSCNITHEGATTILEALHACKNLKTLNVSNNRLSNAVVARSIGDFLRVNTTLVNLDVSANNITFEGTKMIGDGLKVHRILTELNISSANIKDEGVVKVIEEAIRLNSFILKLNISDNEITDRGLAAISNYLKTHPTLVELDISKNNITDEGAKVFAEIIQVNRTLLSLSISFNSHDRGELYTFNNGVYKGLFDQSMLTKGDIRIVEAVSENTNLQSLNVYFCKTITRCTFNLALIDAMYHNDTLTRLILPSMLRSDFFRMGRNAIIDINKRREKLGLNCLHVCDSKHFYEYDNLIDFTEW